MGRSPTAELGGDEGGSLVASLEPGLIRTLGLTGELASDVAVARLSVDAVLEEPIARAGNSRTCMPRTARVA